jgi:hypothetical protein
MQAKNTLKQLKISYMLIATISGIYDKSFSSTTPNNMVANPDGSFTLSFGDKQYIVSSETAALMDVVMTSSSSNEAIGSQGNTIMLANMINYMISQNANDYPDGVPLQILGGDSARYYNQESFYDNISETLSEERKGIAEANIIALMVGDQVLLYVHDQDCDVYSYTNGCGNYLLEGNISQNANGKKTLNATIDSEEDWGLKGKNVQMDIDETIGFYLNVGGIDLGDHNVSGKNYKESVNWDIKFDDPSKQFVVNIK